MYHKLNLNLKNILYDFCFILYILLETRRVWCFYFLKIRIINYIPNCTILNPSIKLLYKKIKIYKEVRNYAETKSKKREEYKKYIFSFFLCLISVIFVQRRLSDFSQFFFYKGKIFCLIFLNLNPDSMLDYIFIQLMLL